MLLFAWGIVHGIFASGTFLYTVLLGLGCYAAAYGDFPENDSIDSIFWFVGRLGGVRLGLYIAVALLWPVVLIAVFVTWLLLRKYEYRENLPEKTLRRLEWVSLGFGKFVPAK